MNYYTQENRPSRKSISFSGVKSLTKQSFANEVNINQIIARYNKTGFLVDPSIVPTRVPLMGEFQEFDFLAAQNQLVAAQQSFDALPSVVRNRFSNDPSQLLAFLSDVSNHEEAIKLGLINPKVPNVPQQAESENGQKSV